MVSQSAIFIHPLSFAVWNTFKTSRTMNSVIFQVLWQAEVQFSISMGALKSFLYSTAYFLEKVTGKFFDISPFSVSTENSQRLEKSASGRDTQFISLRSQTKMSRVLKY